MGKLLLAIVVFLIILTANIVFAQTLQENTNSPATACNGNVAYASNPTGYAAWNGQCNGARQADSSGGIGQGCCELACGADSQCDEESAGQGSCTSACKFLDTSVCKNQVDSAYGNKVCRSDVNVSDCNWPNGTESVSIRETSSGIWEVNFTSTSAVDVNIFVVYGRITGVAQPDWKSYAGYIKPEVCDPGSNETTCNTQLLGTHNYCSFRSGSNPSMLPLPNPSMITASNPARGFWPLPLSTSTHSATITVNATEEARRRGVPIILHYQFNKAISIPNNYSWCVPGTACVANECGVYTGCFEYAISANFVLCVKNQDLAAPVVISACGHHAWESAVWDEINLTSAVSSTTTTVFSPVTCSACEINSKCTCTMSGCSAGMWVVRNTTYPPAMVTKTFNLPPTFVDFTPAASGSLEVIAVCDSPIQQTSKATVDVKASMLSCPSVCYAGKECECAITGCSNGTFTVMQGSTAIKTLSFPPVVSSIKFTPLTTDTLTITGTCFEPTRGPTVINVYPSPSTSSSTSASSTSSSSTTTSLSECPYDCCVEESQYTTKFCPEDSECINNKCEGGTDYSILIIVLAVILLIAVPFLLYAYFIRKKSKEKFDQLYRKWPARRRRY